MSEAPFRLYSRLYCHLCEEMLVGLRQWQQEQGFALEVIDIDEHESLRQQYNEAVPVLCDPQGVELCRYRLDPQALARYFRPSAD